MLTAEEICFNAGGREVLRGANVRAAAGELIAVCGGNGDGKTTLLKILAGLLPPDSGEVRWQNDGNGGDSDNNNEHFIYIGHKTALCGELTPLENLRALSALRERKPKRDLPQTLSEWNANFNIPCAQLSAGQQRRATMARLDSLQAEMWLLDEPLASLDSEGRELFFAALARHLKEGGAAAVTCHTADALPSATRIVRPGVN